MLLRRDGRVDEADAIRKIINAYSSSPDAQSVRIRRLPFYATLLVEDYLPRLRRVSYEMVYSRYRPLTDEEIAALYAKDPRSLTPYNLWRHYKNAPGDAEREVIMRDALSAHPDFLAAATDLSALMINRGEPGESVLEPFFADQAKVAKLPEVTRYNMGVCAMSASHYSLADSLMVDLPDTEIFHKGKAYSAALAGRYIDVMQEISEDSPLNEVLLLLAMKDNDTAVKQAEKLGDSARRFPRSYEEYEGSKRYFLNFSGGAGRRFRGDYGNGLAFAVGFGKRFTPVSSWRLSVDGEAFRRYPGYVSLVLGADYICGISTSMAGFNDHRVFDLSGVIGVFGGVANYYDPAKPVFGGKVGLLGAFRLSDALSLNIEPQVLALNAKGAGTTGWTPEFRVMLGLNYWLGRGASFAKNALDKSPLEGRRNFVSVSAGPGVASSTVLSGSRVVNGSFDAAVGRWFSPVSGMRVGMAYDYIPASDGNRAFNVGTAHLDYMLNVTSLITRDAGRRFHIIGLVGAGCGFSDAATSSVGLMAEAGVQFRYNLPGNFDMHIEPVAGAWMHRVMPGLREHKRLVGLGRVMVGTSYRF